MYHDGPNMVKNTFNTELNDLRRIICLRKYEVTAEGISVCKVIEKLLEHGWLVGWLFRV